MLSEDKYKDFHVPGAVNVPLGDDFEERIETAIHSKAPALATTAARRGNSPRIATRMYA